MSAWDNLSIREKAAMMRAAISNGITNIDDIRREYNEFAEGGPIGESTFTSELDWSPESWFSKRAAKPDGTYYNEEEAARLASHVPEYLTIEENAKNNGTWLQNSDGSKWEGDPRSWVMMQSEAYKKNYSAKPWYTGQAEWPTKFDYGQGTVETNKVTRAPYYNEQMWFSDNKDYGDTFANYQNSKGTDWRFDTPGEENIKGQNFLAAIPKKGNYRHLEGPSNSNPDNWQHLPFDLKNNTINRLPAEQIILDSKGRNIRADKQKVLTDDIVNWSKSLGDQGIFMYNVDDGDVIKDGYITPQPVNEFISQPGFTDKVKFIEGNTGDFDINNPYKYAYVPTAQKSGFNIAALGGNLFDIGGPTERDVERLFWENKMDAAKAALEQVNKNKPKKAPTPIIDRQLPELLVFPERSQGEITPVTGNALSRAINNYTGELKYDLANNRVPSGKYTLPAAVLGAAGLTGAASLPAIGEAYHAAGLSPLVMEGLAAPYTAHGLDNLIHGNADWQTALEIAPLGRLARPMYNAGKKAVYNIADRYIFMPHQNSFTRGIGITDAGLQDAVNTGVFRGNPRGTEYTAKQFTKGDKWNRDHFKDIMNETGIDDIASKFQSRTLSEEEFNAIKEASKKYVTSRMELVQDNSGKLGFRTIEIPADPLEPYPNYASYKDDIAKTVAEVEKMPYRVQSGEIKINNELTPTVSGLPHGKPIEERFGPNSDYVADGHPMSYWYPDGRNPVTQGHAYAKSNYGVRVNNPEDYQPFMHELHLHPSFFRSPKFSDPNVEIFGKGPLGLTVKLDKETLQPLWKKDLSNIFKGNKVISPQITAENAASITSEQWTAAQDAAIAKAFGGELYPDGGILGNVTRGMKVDTDQCATWSNGLLRDNGYLINGDAWRLNNVDTLFNGFTGLEKPAVYDRKAVEAYNHMASDNVYRNFDSKTLDKTQPYVVNMYYNNSPALEDAYNNGKGVTGTHTGILTYDNDKQKWVVTHNIHGKIHQENFVPLQSGKGKYGVTAIYQPREDNLVNRVKGFFGFADGGRLYPDGGGMQSLYPNVGRAIQYFVERGLTDYQAAGLVGNLMRESSMNPSAVNKDSQAYGLAQWLGDRKTNLFKRYGNNPTFEQQLDYVWDELNSTHKRGLKMLKASKSAEEAARNAMGYYEFSAGPEKAIANMIKHGQDGEGSMRKGVNFAMGIMGQKPVEYVPQMQLPPNYNVLQNLELPTPQYTLDELTASGTMMPAKELPLTTRIPSSGERPNALLDLLAQYQYLDSLLSQ